MDGRMPVEAAVEARVQDARRYGVGRTLEQVLRVIRILAADIGERAARERVRDRRVERRTGGVLRA